MNATTGSAEFLDLRQLVRRLWAGRYWLAASVAVCAAAALTYALASDQVYRATVVMAPAEANGGQGGMSALLGQASGLASLVGINIGQHGANVDEALAVLRSRDFTVRFFEAEQVLRKFYPESWDERANSWKPSVGPPSISRAYKYFDNGVRHVVQDRKTGLVSVSIDWTDRHDAAKWANELTRRLNEEMRGRAIDNANLSIGYLQRELAATSAVEVREAINRLIEGQIKQRMLANVNQEYALRVIDRAVVPEADEPVRPRRARIVAVGMVLGFVLAAMVMVLVDYFRGRWA